MIFNDNRYYLIGNTNTQVFGSIVHSEDDAAKFIMRSSADDGHQVIEFNPVEGYSRDVTEDVFRKLPGGNDEYKTVFENGLIKSVEREDVDCDEEHHGGNGKAPSPEKPYLQSEFI